MMFMSKEMMKRRRKKRKTGVKILDSMDQLLWVSWKRGKEERWSIMNNFR